MKSLLEKSLSSRAIPDPNECPFSPAFRVVRVDMDKGSIVESNNGSSSK